MEHDPKLKRSHFVCFQCRKMFRKTLLRYNFGGSKEGEENLCCAECGGRLVNIGRGFEPPRHSNLKSWKQVEMLYAPGKNWFAASDGDCSAPRKVGALKYYAKLPKRVVEQRQREAEQRLLRDAKGQKKRQQLEKRQQRLTSRSNKGRSLTNINDKPKYWT